MTLLIAKLWLKQNWLYVLVCIATMALCWFIWSWFERGDLIEDYKEADKSKEAVIDLTTQRQQDEQEISKDEAERIENINKLPDDGQPMDAAMRAAIDSLYK